MVYVPARKLKPEELQIVSRAFGISPRNIVETAKRVEVNRCDHCGDLSCQHDRKEIS